MLNGELRDEFDQHGRQRRPPTDPVNSCLSMAYSMLTNECISSLRTGRLEPSIGAMHVSRPGRPALAFDLMEPFRMLILHARMIAAWLNGEIATLSFLTTR